MKKFISIAALLAASLAHAQPPTDADTAAAQQLMDRHFAVWNDTDAARRAASFAQLYSADVLFADYHGVARGHAGVGEMIQRVQDGHAGYRFTPEPVTWNHGLGRVRWGYGPQDDPNRIRGEDIFTIQGGKLASAYVFFDKN